MNLFDTITNTVCTCPDKDTTQALMCIQCDVEAAHKWFLDLLADPELVEAMAAAQWDNEDSWPNRVATTPWASLSAGNRMLMCRATAAALDVLAGRLT